MAKFENNQEVTLIPAASIWFGVWGGSWIRSQKF